MPQIEDMATVDALDEFLAVPGIDAVAIGPNDLSGTTGFFRQHDHPANAGAIDTIMARAKAAGIPVCTGVTSRPDQQRDLIARGVLVLTVTTDVELLAGGAAPFPRRQPRRDRRLSPAAEAQQARSGDGSV